MAGKDESNPNMSDMYDWNHLIKQHSDWKVATIVVIVVFLVGTGAFVLRDYLSDAVFGVKLWWENAEFNPLDLETQIIDFWGAAEVVDIVIGEVKVKDGKIKLVGRTVTMYSDTLFGLPYEFIRYRSGFRLTKKLKFEPAYRWKLEVGEYTQSLRDHLMKVGLKNVKYFATLVQDMQYVAGFFEIFATYTRGKYPAHLGVKVKDVPGHCKGVPYDHTVLGIAKRAFHKEVYIVQAVGDTWEWFPEYRNKIVYFPLDIKGNVAMRFIVKGSIETVFIDYEIRNRFGYKYPWKTTDDRTFIK